MTDTDHVPAMPVSVSMGFTQSESNKIAESDLPDTYSGHHLVHVNPKPKRSQWRIVQAPSVSGSFSIFKIEKRFLFFFWEYVTLEMSLDDAMRTLAARKKQSVKKQVVFECE